MKKKLLALSLALSASTVFAQTSNFEGASVGLGFAAVGTNTKISGDTGNFIDMGKTSVIPALDFSYAYAIDSKWLLGVGATYDLGKTKAGGAQLSDGSDTETINFEGKNHYSVYVQPTYTLTNTTAVFAKLGYHSMKGTESYTHTTDGSGSASSRLKGIGYGVGVKTFIDKNLYLQAEALIVDFKSKTVSDDEGSATYKVKSNGGLITLGYKF